MTLRKKILHLNSYFVTNKLHSELVKKLDEKGFTQTVFIPVENKKQIGVNSVNNLKNTRLIYSNCFNAFTRYIWPVKMLQIWQSLKKTIKNTNMPDLIHAHTLIVNGIPAYWIHKKWKTPYIVTIRNTDINLFLKKFPFFRKIAWKVLQHAGKIIALSPAYGYNQLSSFFSDEQNIEIRNKLLINPNGINNFWLQNEQLISNKNISNPVILFVGRIDRNKNLGTLIQACEILFKKGKKIKLKVVGDGYLLNSIKNGNYFIEIEYAGHINNKDDLLNQYRNAHILAVPSFTESFGLVYAEAMTQGLPVIYTKHQGFDGYFEEGEIGFAVQANNPEDISDKISLILNNYTDISKRAFKNSKRFSWDTVCDILEKVYESPI